MASAAVITKGKVIENSAVVLLARIAGADGSDVAQSDITSATLKVYDSKAGTQVGSTVTLTVADVVFNTLQLDSRWPDETTGYNFAYELAGTFFPDDKLYQVEIKFVPVAGEPFYLVWQLTAVNIFSE
jgi:hypothetical protein